MLMVGICFEYNAGRLSWDVLWSSQPISCLHPGGPKPYGAGRLQGGLLEQGSPRVVRQVRRRTGPRQGEHGKEVTSD